MKVRDIMTYNVVTISSGESIAGAYRIMLAHNVRRLPVMDRGRLVGVVNMDEIHKAQPSPATSLSIWEVNYILAKMTVKDIMHKGAVTIDPDTNVEEALATAQSNKVGSLLVVEDGILVGIITTNDFIFKVLNPIVGVGAPGKKFYIENCYRTNDIFEVINIVNKLGVELASIHTVPYPPDKHAILALRLASEDDTEIVKAIEKKGYKVERVNIKEKV